MTGRLPRANTPLRAVRRRLQDVQPFVPGPHEVEVGQLERQPFGAPQPQLRVHHLRTWSVVSLSVHHPFAGA